MPSQDIATTSTSAQLDTDSSAWVIGKSLVLQLLLLGAMLLAVVAPYSRSFDDNAWEKLLGLTLMCVGSLVLMAMGQIRRAKPERRLALALRPLAIFAVGCVLSLAFSWVSVLAEPELPDFIASEGLVFTHLLVAALRGVAAVLAFILIEPFLTRLRWQSILGCLLAIHMLWFWISGGLHSLYFDGSPFSYLLFNLTGPVYSLYFHPVAAPLLSLALLAWGWWVSNGLLPGAQQAPTLFDGRFRQLLGDFFGGRLSLLKTFWYIACIGGFVFGWLVFSLALSNANLILMLLVLLLAASFWTLVFIRLLEAGRQYEGKMIWEVLAVILVGAQMVGAIIGVIMLIHAFL
ncbi:MAG: hypothetical protein CVV07_10150 [Gammaproteobacteria bacterium HGW-Gammaproteobacteria-11]|nr:MAG: hypothetical protein CVV07_10150 [Gammaproteobacteria bacterium HGW-Gammaproteobacteria-11]